MTAYDFAAWADFAGTVAGGAAALAGLVFVGLSLNLAEVLKYPGVPARAAATLG
jgi:modulator of FtsH protease